MIWSWFNLYKISETRAVKVDSDIFIENLFALTVVVPLATKPKYTSDNYHCWKVEGNSSLIDLNLRIIWVLYSSCSIKKSLNLSSTFLKVNSKEMGLYWYLLLKEL